MDGRMSTKGMTQKEIQEAKRLIEHGTPEQQLAMVGLLREDISEMLDSKKDEAHKKLDDAFIKAKTTAEMLSLFEKGADIDARDSNGNTKIILAASDLNISQVYFLVCNKANVNAQNNEGRTALHLVFCSSFSTEPAHMASRFKEALEIYTFLIKHGASEAIRDNDHRTPNEHANQMHQKLLSLLHKRMEPF